MKKILKNWTLFEKLFLLVSVIVLTICFVFELERNIFSFIVSIIGVISVLTVAKGLTIAPIINIVYNIIYAILAITQRYYGEAIIYIFLMVPISLFSIISWFKNKSKRDSNVVKVNKIHGIEYLWLAFGTLLATICFYFLLKALNTNELIVSTVSLISSAIASYLMLRRCSYYAIGFIVNDIILIVLWSLVVKKNGIEYLTTVISFVVFLINDIYGFFHWKLEEKTNKLN